MWNKAGIPPQNVEDLGPEVWQPSGITVLGTPIGSELYVHFGEVGRAVGEGKGSLGSDPHGARLAVRMADTASERQPDGKPHNAHDATKLLRCVLFCA